MKTFISTLFCLFAIVLTCHAQMLYGTTSAGGKLGGGTICTYNPATQALNAVKSFSVDGTSPSGSLTLASNGKLYGTTSYGGKYDKGTIISYDPITGIYIQLVSFNDINGANPNGSLIQAADGKLYGTTRNGGGNGESVGFGVIFSYDPATSSYKKLYDFDETNGGFPEGSLLEASDGKLYGVTGFGGNNNYGVIFSYDPATSTYTKLHDFDGTTGFHPFGNLIQATDGKLYGMANGQIAGVIFSYDLSTATYTNLYNFDVKNGAYPRGSLMQAADGNLYGTASGGGERGVGVIFSFNPFTLTYTKLYDFDPANGDNPTGNLKQASDGKLYGMASSGGKPDVVNGVIFSYDLSTSTYTKLYNFSGSNGSGPSDGFIQTPDGKLYALTSGGGTANKGVLFSFDITSATYNKLKDFGTNQEGSTLSGSLCQALDGNLYGMTTYGGSNGLGVIFSYNPATNAFTKLYDFNNCNGAKPFGGLIQASDGKLYGMTTNGGENGENFGGYGVIFSYDPSTATYTKLYDFDLTIGNHPTGDLLQATNGKLYGMTNSGGNHLSGNIFSYNPSSSSYMNLYNFDVTTGTYPGGNLLQASDGKLYGMTKSGGSKDSGVVFSFNIAADTGNFQKLANFTSTTGGLPLFSSFIEVFSCTPRTYYRDADGDGYGNPDSTIQSCFKHKGYVRDSTDCNDQDSTIHPGAVEICGDGIDNNCDGRVDENCTIPTISIGDAITFEGNSGYKKMHFHVRLSTAAYDTIQVHYTTVRGTAKPLEDYVPIKGTLTFMPAEKEQTITVLIKGEQQVEFPEFFTVQLSKAVNASISKEVGIGIIINDDLSSSAPLTNAQGNTTANLSLVVAPNPASSVVNVQLSGFKGNTLLQLLSPQGRLLKTIKLQLKSTTNQQLNVADLAGGTYFLMVTDQEGDKQTVKLVVAR